MKAEVEYKDFDEVQNQLDQWVSELKERLKLDQAQVKKALVDWVIVNTDTDWLALAAKDDAAMGTFGGGELAEFLSLATKAFHNAWGGAASQGQELDEVLNRIEDLIDNYREQRDICADTMNSAPPASANAAAQQS